MAMTLITTNPDSTDVSSVVFTSGLDSTYKLYIFKWFDINPATDNTDLTFQVNASGESGYNETMTSTSFDARHDEADGDSGISYSAHNEQQQGTAYQELATNIGNGADESSAGYLHLFDPSSTTYAKQWYSQSISYERQNVARIQHNGGYINTTGAITQVQFKINQDEFAGVIKMWGVK